MLKETYQGKKVLITGHTGFKGSWLSLWLHLLGADVAGLSLYIPSQPANFEVLNLDQLMTDYRCDIQDYQQLKKYIDDFQPDIIFHLAAQPLVRESYRNPRLTFSTNALGTLNVLECIRHCDSVRAGVIITSDKAYRNVEWPYGYRETDTLGGDDPYSGSKGCAELVTYSYMRSYFHEQSHQFIATTRAGNVIGGGDWAEERLVPDCIRAWTNNKPVTIRSPHATRPWQHVLEPLSGYLLLGAELLKGNEQCRNQAYNFGPNDLQTYTVAHFLQCLQTAWPDSQINFENPTHHMKEANLLKLCCDKALHDLRWTPTLTFEDTVSMINEWYQAYYAGDMNMLELTQKQITFFEEKSKTVFSNNSYTIK